MEMDNIQRMKEDFNKYTKPFKFRKLSKKQEEEKQLRAIRNHNCKKAGCGPICTYGEY